MKMGIFKALLHNLRKRNYEKIRIVRDSVPVNVGKKRKKNYRRGSVAQCDPFPWFDQSLYSHCFSFDYQDLKTNYDFVPLSDHPDQKKAVSSMYGDHCLQWNLHLSAIARRTRQHAPAVS